MTISWLRELDDHTTEYVLELPAHPERGQHGRIVVDDEAFALIDEYAFSVPTAPSAGRIYRRTYDDGTAYVFVVVDHPTDDGTQLHVPCEVVERLETAAPVDGVFPDGLELEWLHTVDSVGDDATRRHNALVYAAVLCFAGDARIDDAVRRYHTDSVFHARCQQLAHLVGRLP